MKTSLILLVFLLSLSSCATIFTKSKQPITFMGEPGIKIYQASSNVKIGEIGEEKSTTIEIKKKLGDTQLIAKKEGRPNTPLILESSFNTTSLWNILFWPGFLVDLGTGQMNKYDNSVIQIEMEE